jgi:hypothetical protein
MNIQIMNTLSVVKYKKIHLICISLLTYSEQPLLDLGQEKRFVC